MPLSITKDQWVKETAAAMRPRSTELTRLDDAIGAGNPFLAKAALDKWIAAQMAKNQKWQTSVRNSRGAVKRLYDELGLEKDLKLFVDRLVVVTVNCRAGSRVLQVNNQIEGMSASALLWVVAALGQSLTRIRVTWLCFTKPSVTSATK